MEEVNPEIKIILLGESGVGKTNLINVICNLDFQINPGSTSAAFCREREYKYKNNSYIYTLWDTAGQEKYRSMTSTYYKGSKGAFVIYDITRKETFESVDNWINDLKLNGDPNIIVFIIGNKNDLEESREVTKDEGEEKGLSFQCGFLETSALSGDNIDEAFDLMITEIFDRYKKDIKDEESFKKGEDLNLDKGGNNKKGCC